MNRGHLPERTCRGCGRKRPQTVLLRYTVIEGRLVEQQSSLSGRGIYCCNESICRERLAKNKKILKAD